MTVVSKPVILSYNKCAELAIMFNNILESFYHKEEGVVVKKIEDIDKAIQITFSNGVVKDFSTVKILDSITSDDQNKALSANQGKVLKQLIDANTSNQVSGFIARKNLTDLPVTGDSDTAYFVLDDQVDVNNNGVWGWDGAAYFQASKTVKNTIEENNTAEAISGKAVYDHSIETIRSIKQTTLPAKNEALFVLDGTILQDQGSYYLKDVSGNGRHFLITGYDFDKDWSFGFPYKTKATISAPLGDSVLQAADTNNFLYDTSNNPVQISSISLFQNIDFNNKIFCKHIKQVTNNLQVEKKQPYIQDVVMYSNPLSGISLALAENYFEVPVKETNAIWVSKTGDDATGDGTEDNPYATPNKAYSVATTEPIYIKTGSYTFTTDSRTYFRHEKELNITGLGNVIADNSSNPDPDFVVFCLSASGSSIVSGIEFLTSTEKWCFSGNTSSVNRCKIHSGSTSAIRAFSSPKFKDSILIGGRLSDYSDGYTLDTCVILLDSSSNGFERSTAENIYLKNNKVFVENCGNLCRSTVANNDYNFIGNVVVINNSISSLYSHNQKPDLLNFVGNKFFAETAFTSNLLFNLRSSSVIFDDNTIILGDKTSDYTVVECSDTTLVSYDDNLVVTLSRGNVSHLVVTGNTAITGCVLKRNKSISYGNSDIIMLVGSDGSTAYDNNINGIVIHENYVKNMNGGANNGIFVGFNLDADIKYNFILGHPHAIVYKHNDAAGNNNQGVMAYNLSKGGTFITFGLPDALVYNNTCYMNANESIEAIIVNDNPTLPENCKIKNNLIYAIKRKNYSYKMIKFLSATGLECDNNAYYQELADASFRLDGEDKTFAELQALGYDVNSFNDEEIYLDPQTLIPSGHETIAIGKGVNLPSNFNLGIDPLNTDWGDDNTLPKVVLKEQTPDKWDLGAYVL